MFKRLLTVFALVITLVSFNASISEAAYGETSSECFRRVIFENTWVYREGGGTVVDMKRFMSDIHLESCDVESENMSFTFTSPNGTKYTANVMNGSGMMLWDSSGYAGSFIRFS
jgi:hypothetical protein